MNPFSWLLDTSGFPARWHCGTAWADAPSLGWLHILSDLAIWGAYLAIPIVLLFFLRQRRDLPFQKIFLLFGAFILACGTTHLIEAVIFWHPIYRLAGVVKLLTAVVSWATVFALFRVVPLVLTMKSAAEWQTEVDARQRAEQALQASNDLLEIKISERTRELSLAAERLHSERELLNITLASIGDGVIVTDESACVTFLNDIAQNLTGWSQDQAMGQNLLQVFRIVNETTREPVENPALRALSEGRIIGLANHTILIAKDGGERHIDDSAAPIRDKSGGLRGSVLVFRDISARRQSEEARRQSEEREHARLLQLETVLRVTPIPILISHDPQCEHVYGNDAFRRLTGIPAEANQWDSANRRILSGFQLHNGTSSLEVEYQPLFRAAKGQDVPETELTIVSADTRDTRHLLCNASPIRDSDGTLKGAVAALVDITSLRQVHEALQDMDRRKDDFLATLAHELRNPLAPMRNAVELIKRVADDATLVTQANAMMGRQVEHMVRLIDDLLDISRIARGKIRLRKERVLLSVIVQRSVEMVTPHFADAGLDLSVGNIEPLWIEVDVARATQIFSNLLNNACKFTPSGRVVMSVTRDHDYAVVKITDSGIGIPADMLQDIFEMFTQVDASLNKTYGGLGLGLTLVKSFVEMHGGFVTAQSEGAGLGSVFTVRLPIVD